MKIEERFNKIYFNKSPLTKKDMYVSRTLSIFEGATARTIFTFTGGAFIAGYSRYLGANDQVAGIIAAIPTLAGMIMAFSPIIFERLGMRKLLVAILCLLGRLLLGSMVFIPLLTPSMNNRLLLLMGIFLVASLALSFTLPAAQTWIVNLTPLAVRGKYFGIRESYVLAFVSVVTLIMGRILDIFQQSGNEYGGFRVLFVIVAVFAVLNSFFLSSMREEAVVLANSNLSVLKVITLPLKDRHFRKIILFVILWNISFQLSAPFSAVYMVSGLKLGYTYITIMTTLASVISISIVRFWGKLADRKSWVFLMKLLVLIQALCHFTWFLTNQHTALLLVPLAHVLSGAAASGINIAIFNLQFGYMPEKNKTVYIGFSSAIGGVVGFGGTLLGSMLVGALGTYRLNFFGFTVGNMQIVFILSCAALLVCAVFIHYFIRGKGSVK